MIISTIFHNPQCSTSRKALELMRARGLQPTVVEYLKTPPDRDTLETLIAESGRPTANFVRHKDALFETLGLGAEGVTDAQRIDALVAHPQLLERPIVVTEQGTRLARPLEALDDILPAAR